MLPFVDLCKMRYYILTSPEDLSWLHIFYLGWKILWGLCGWQRLALLGRLCKQICRGANTKYQLCFCSTSVLLSTRGHRGRPCHRCIFLDQAQWLHRVLHWDNFVRVELAHILFRCSNIDVLLRLYCAHQFIILDLGLNFPIGWTQGWREWSMYFWLHPLLECQMVNHIISLFSPSVHLFAFLHGFERK